MNSANKTETLQCPKCNGARRLNRGALDFRRVRAVDDDRSRAATLKTYVFRVAVRQGGFSVRRFRGNRVDGMFGALQRQGVDTKSTINRDVIVFGDPPTEGNPA